MNARTALTTLFLVSLAPGCTTFGPDWATPTTAPPTEGAREVRVLLVSGDHTVVARPKVDGREYVGWRSGARGPYQWRVPLDSIISFEIPLPPPEAPTGPRPGMVQMQEPPAAGTRSVWVNTTNGKKVQLHRPVVDQSDYVGWIDTVRGRQLRRFPMDSIVHYRYRADSESVPEGAIFEPDTESVVLMAIGGLLFQGLILTGEALASGDVNWVTFGR
jgi:hypothetical protein